MSRVDRPRLKCDRQDCGYETEDISEMGSFLQLTNDHMSGRDKWDLCPPCATKFFDFVGRPKK